MAIKKTMSQRAILANRNNGRKSRGPNNTRNTRYNAITHGILAKNLRFNSEDEKKAFDALISELVLDHRPCGPTESSQVFVMGVCLWKLGDLLGWQHEEIRNRSNAGKALLEAVQYNHNAYGLPLSAATQQGWEAQELTLRAGNQAANKESYSQERQKTENVIVEARMTTSLETISRYAAEIKRDFYRALATLLELQRTRLELEE